MKHMWYKQVGSQSSVMQNFALRIQKVINLKGAHFEHFI